MPTSWSGREAIASDFTNVITGVNYNGETVVLANSEGEILLGFSDSGTPVSPTVWSSDRDNI